MNFVQDKARGLLAFIVRLSRSGVDESMTADLGKRVILCNWVAMILALNASLLFPGFFVQGMIWVVVTNVLSIIVGITIPILNTKRYYNLSRGILIPFLIGLVTFTDYAMIEVETPRLWLFPISFLGFLLYGEQEKKKAFASALMALVALIGISAITVGHQVGFYHNATDQILPMTLIDNLLVLITIVGLVIIFYNENLIAQKKIQREKEKLSFIFDLVEEAVITTNSKGLVQPEFSRFTEVLFEESHDSIKDRQILDLIFSRSDVPPDLKDQCLATLESAWGADEIQWLGNENLLIHECRIHTKSGDKHIHIKWQPIYSEDVIRGVLVTIQDVTREKQEQLLQQQQKALFEIIQAACRHSKASVVKFLKSGVACSELQGIDSLSKLKINLHTLKGAARTLELKLLASALHTLEDQLAVESQWPLSEGFRSRLKDLAKEFAHAQSKINEMFADNHAEAQQPVGLLSVGQVLHDLCRRHAVGHGLIFLGFSVTDHAGEWDAETLQKLGEALMHAVTNAIDHGYVYPEKEGRLQRRAVEITVAAVRQDENLVIRFADRGAGISAQQLEKLRLKAKVKPEDLKDPFDVLFLEGVSSAEALTQTSGRGVGMTAIKQIAEELGGGVRVSSTVGQGTTIEICIPPNRALALAAAS